MRSIERLAWSMTRWVSAALLAGLAACGGGKSGGTAARGDATPPTTPVIQAIVPASTTEIDLAWSASTDDTGVAGYRVYRGGTLVATPVDPVLADTGLAPGTQYCYEVAAYDVAGNVSARSASSCATTLPAPPDSAPTGVDALGADRQVTLRWGSVTGATSYNVYYATAPGITPQNWASWPGGGLLQGVSSPYVQTGLTDLTTYFYVITAVSAGGEGAASAQVAAQPVPGLASGWTWLQPRLTGESLQAVRFVDASNGWAVGAAGTVLHTGDGGATWARQDAATTSSLQDVDFVDATTGWAVGYHFAGQYLGAVFKTEDGGATWRSQACGTASTLFGVDFVDGSNGWAVGEAGTIVHTVDGGRTWVAQASGTDAILWRVRFRDALTGWAVGGNGSVGVVLRTTDGGATWRSTSISPAQIVDVAFVSATRGFAVDGASTGRILGSTDGGATWGQLPTGAIPSPRAIAFSDADHGWVVGSSGLVLRTSNGGASWSAVPSGTGSVLSGISLLASDEAIVVGGGGTIRHTADGGLSWTDQGGARTLPSIAPGTLSFADASHGWAAVGATAYRTADGGLTWAAQPTFASGPLMRLQFVSGTTGFAVGSSSGPCGTPPCNAVYRTDDGGTTWPLRGYVATTANVQVWQVDFADAQHGWAVAVGGLILATTDGGATWVAQSSGTSNLLTAVKALDASTAWVAGQGGMILKTVNGGATWLGQLSGTTESLNAITAVDANRAWAVGGSSWPGLRPIVATTDGGATWTPQAHPGEGPLQDVRFASATTGWVVGGGLVLGTTDGGATWTQQRGGTAQGILQIAAVSATTAWLATSTDLLGTTTGGW